MSDDLHLDGNGIAGLLGEALLFDPTTLLRRCRSCGEQHALGEHRAYRGAGVVLRCPNCGDAGVVIGIQEDRLVVRAHGAYTVARAPAEAG
ncbi:MAG TPA: DUF6510 family protein [Capillimicrobium sp.]|nr:DUF6510 family protein [Capillimicrobium sp.]